MDANIYLRCIESQGYESGNAVAIYDSLTGDQELYHNIKYPTGQSYINGLVNSTKFPLVSLDSDAVTGNFTGDSCYQVGYKVGFPEWSFILDVSNDRYCATGLNNDKMMIANTFSNYKGFGVYFTEAHRLAAVVSTSPYERPSIYVINKEVPQNCLVYLGIDSGNALSFGYYDLENETLVAKSVDIRNTPVETDVLYFGGFYRYPTNYGAVPSGAADYLVSGEDFSGKFYKGVLFSGMLSEFEADICFGCLFATGIGIETETGLVDVATITGYEYSVVYEIEYTGDATGSAIVTGNNNSPVNFYVSSGQTGLLAKRDVFTPLSGVVSTVYTGLSIEVPQYDVSAKLARISYSIDFNLPLESGDHVIVYTYNEPNVDVNHSVKNYYAEPRDGMQFQLWGNGLLETPNVDYTVDGDQIYGFESSDRLLNDYTTGESIIVDYSGWWARGRIWLNSGSGGTKKYYPETGLFPEGDGGEIYITGIDGQPVYTGYDVYLDGQQLIYGVSYSTGFFSGVPAVILSGSGLPDFIADVTYSGNGDVSGIANEDSAELIFYPKEHSPNYYRFDITSTKSTLTGIKGYDTQVWLNGVRQYDGYGFIISRPCSLATGFNGDFGDVDFLVFDNEDDIFGLI